MLNEMQEKLYTMMQWFHDFCRKHELKYYMIGGTMLGAVRHEGFIPWDDDMDIGMPRTDYEKMLSLIKVEYCDKYILESYKDGAADFNYTFAKLYDTDTTLTENNRYRTQRGIYIDIFPIDKMGESYEEARFVFKKIRMKIDLLNILTLGYSKRRAFYKNLAIFFARLIPQKLINTKTLIKDIDLLCRSKEDSNGKWMGVFLGVWGEKEIMPHEYFGNPRLYKFENSQFFGVNMPNEYLANLYNEWNLLPPESNRISHHEYLHIDLNMSYRKDINEK